MKFVRDFAPLLVLLQADDHELWDHPPRGLAGEHLPTVVLLKNVYALWNCTVDDEIDREARRDELERERAAAGDVQLRQAPSTAEEARRRCCRSSSPRIPVDRGGGEEFVPLPDLLEVIHGFRYEHLINRSPRLANSVEYGRYGATMTASFKVHLDIDMARSVARRSAPGPTETLRIAYDLFSTALEVRLRRIGSLRRELADEDNLNSVRIHALEHGIANATPGPGGCAGPRARRS